MTLSIRTNYIGVAGDWHCNTGWVKRTIFAFHSAGIKHIFQLGDFGIWGGHDGASFIRKIAKWLDLNDQYLYVTPGNHEDYVRIAATPIEEEDGTQWYQGNSRIKLLPRGFRGVFQTNDKEVDWLSLGGANSIDFKGRREGISWWREESITVGDIYKVAEKGHAEIMFCHDAPAGVSLILDKKSDKFGWHPDEIHYANSGRETLRQAVDTVQPRVLFHGHYHIYQDISTELSVLGSAESYDIRTIGLACDEHDNSAIVYDVAAESYSLLKV